MKMCKVEYDFAELFLSSRNCAAKQDECFFAHCLMRDVSAIWTAQKERGVADGWRGNYDKFSVAVSQDSASLLFVNALN